MIVEDALVVAGHGVIRRLRDGECGEEALQAVGDGAQVHLGVEARAEEELVEVDQPLEVLKVVGCAVVDDLL